MTPQEQLIQLLYTTTDDPKTQFENVCDLFREFSTCDIDVIKRLLTILLEWLDMYGSMSNEVLYMTYHMTPIFNIVVPKLNEETRIAFAQFLAVVYADLDMNAITQNWYNDDENIAYFQHVKDSIKSSYDKIAESVDDRAFSHPLSWEVHHLIRLLT